MNKEDYSTHRFYETISVSLLTDCRRSLDPQVIAEKESAVSVYICFQK